MKFSIVALITFIICFSTYVSTQESKDPLDDVLQKKFNMTQLDLIETCMNKKTNDLQLFIEARDKSYKERGNLADAVLNNAKKMPKVNEKDWDAIVDKSCGKNSTAEAISKSELDKTNKCLGDKKKLNGEQQKKIAKVLFKGFCTSVKTLAKEKYGKGKN